MFELLDEHALHAVALEREHAQAHAADLDGVALLGDAVQLALDQPAHRLHRAVVLELDAVGAQIDERRVAGCHERAAAQAADAVGAIVLVLDLSDDLLDDVLDRDDAVELAVLVDDRAHRGARRLQAREQAVEVLRRRCDEHVAPEGRRRLVAAARRAARR